MEAEFWHKKWEDREIGFHEGQPNSFLVKHFSALGLEKNSRLFLPLCGKTRDISWFLEQGFRVAGAELNESAVRELFLDLEREPKVTEFDKLQRYSAKGLDIFVGDIFELTPQLLGPVDGVYDRAAMVALPEETRVRYAQHLRSLTAEAPQLLITFQYDRKEMQGPPFSISQSEVEGHYGPVNWLESRAVAGKLRGHIEAEESVCLVFQT